MASFLTGLIQGGATTAAERKKNKQPGLLSKVFKKKDKGYATDDAGQKVPNFHRGGKVKKTGLARLKKGERVLTAKQAKKRGGSRR